LDPRDTLTITIEAICRYSRVQLIIVAVVQHVILGFSSVQDVGLIGSDIDPVRSVRTVDRCRKHHGRGQKQTYQPVPGSKKSA
jgi:hypothetical protein